MVVASAERVEVRVNWTGRKGAQRFGGACDAQEFGLQGPPVVVESPGALRDVDMAGVPLVAWPEPDGSESCFWIDLHECVREDVASTSGEERHIVPVPREPLIPSFGLGAPETRTWTVHALEA